MHVDSASSSCGSYRPGHDVHFIQWKLATRGLTDPASAPAPAHLLELDPSGLVVAKVGDVVHRWWIHDPDDLERLAPYHRGTVSYQRRWHLLLSPSPGGRRLFNVADADDPSLRPCRPAPYA